MSLCAAAAYHTIPTDFTLDNLQAHFLGGPKTTIPMILKVTRLSNGRRFVVRFVSLEQDGIMLLTATVTFVNASPWTGPAMTHAVNRQTNYKVDSITMDDLGEARGRLGSFMKFERMPLVFQGRCPWNARWKLLTACFLPDPSKAVTSGIATAVAQISPAIDGVADNAKTHILGVINLSDYHVMDTPLQLNNISMGLPTIGDVHGPRKESQVKVGTTLNHSIHFHVHDGFRADDLTYIEVETSWGKDGRAMLSSRIFSKQGLLIATCIQEVGETTSLFMAAN